MQGSQNVSNCSIFIIKRLTPCLDGKLFQWTFSWYLLQNIHWTTTIDCVIYQDWTRNICWYKLNILLTKLIEQLFYLIWATLLMNTTMIKNVDSFLAFKCELNHSTHATKSHGRENDILTILIYPWTQQAFKLPVIRSLIQSTIQSCF